MAIATNGTKLYAKKMADTTYTELTGMKDFTDMGAKADRIETTTLGSTVKTYIRGLDDTPELEFTFNFENASDATSAFAICKGLASEKNDVDFKLEFPDGTFYSWSGDCSIYVKAGKVNAVLEFHLGVTATKPIVLNAAAGN
ncbi:MAG TPA: phage tail tube protein [Clostridia bacterium]|nr:phage tail tube protein [Clostridia bacterium]